MTQNAISLPKSTIIYSIGNFLSKGLALFLLPFYTHIFTPNEYGIIDTIAIAVAFSSFIISLEIDQGLARYFIDTKHIKSKQSYFSTGFTHYLTAFSLFCAIIILLGPVISHTLFGSKEYTSIIQAASLSMWSDRLFYFFQNQLKWAFKVKLYAAISSLKVILTATCIVIFILVFQFKIIGIYIGTFVSNLMLIGIMTIALKQYFNVKTINIKRWQKMVTFSAPLVISSISAYSLQFLDRLFIRYFLDLHEMGLYGIAGRIASVPGILFSGFSLAFVPYVIRNYKNPNNKQTIQLTLYSVLVLSGILYLGLSLFSPELLTIMTSQQFHRAFTVTPILIANTIIYSVGLQFSIGIGIKKKNNILITNYALCFISNCVLNVFLIPKWGIVGAASATALSLIIALVLNFRGSQKQYFIEYNFKKITYFLIPLVIFTLINYKIGFLISWQSIGIKVMFILFQLVIAHILFPEISTVVIRQATQLTTKIKMKSK